MDPVSKLSDRHKCFVLESLEKWDDLDLDSKMAYLQAMSYLIVRSEKRGASFRELLNTLDVYPDAMLVSELMTIHNSLFEHYDTEKRATLVALPKQLGTTLTAISKDSAE
jgi:hypothetical protein